MLIQNLRHVIRDGGWPVVFLVITMLSSTRIVAAEDHKTSRIIFNDDAQVLSEAPLEETSAFVRGWLDREVAHVPFTTFVFLAATPDICTYQTKVGETFGGRFPQPLNTGWDPGIRGLASEGTDALKVVTQHMKSKGKEVLAAIRMSDTHHRSLDPSMPLCSKFALDNPQYVIQQPDGRSNETALDYSYSQVRDHRFEIMKEIVKNYDVDGLELNFVRWAKHFPRDRGRQNASTMTDYLKRIRKLLDRIATERGRSPYLLGVRVPESVECCWLAGIDIETWVSSKWVDYVVVSTWNNTDPQLPIEEFSRFTKPAGVDTIVVMGNMIGAVWQGAPTILDRGIAMSSKHANGYVGMLINESEARGTAANYFAWGADTISFWNVGIHFGREKTAAPEQRNRIRRWTHAVLDRESVYQGPRTYRFLPMGKGMNTRRPPLRNYPWYDEGYSPLGQRNIQPVQFLPEESGKRKQYPFRMADGRNGEKLTGKMQFWIYHLSENQPVSLDLNGIRFDPAAVHRFPIGAKRSGLSGQRFEIDLSFCPPFRGNNQLGITIRGLDVQRPSPYLEELEVVVHSSECK